LLVSGALGPAVELCPAPTFHRHLVLEARELHAALQDVQPGRLAARLEADPRPDDPRFRLGGHEDQRLVRRLLGDVRKDDSVDEDRRPVASETFAKP